MPNRVRLLVLLSLLTGGTVAPVALPAQQRPRCDSPEHRQFDFWIGEWCTSQDEVPHSTLFGNIYCGQPKVTKS